MQCASCGETLVVGGTGFRRAPAGLVCEPCAAVISVDRVRAIVRAATQPAALDHAARARWERGGTQQTDAQRYFGRDRPHAQKRPRGSVDRG